MDTTPINSSVAIGYGWTSVKKDLWYFVGISLVVAIAGSIGSDKGWSLWDVVGLLVTALLTCGWTTMTLSYYRGMKMPFGALFSQTKQFWRVLGATLLLGIIVGIGFVFLIVPGVYLALKYQFTITLIIDQNLGIFEAMRQSGELTKGKKMSLLGFDLISFGVIILGVLALGVGVFVATPVVWLANIDVYRKLAPAVVKPAVV